MKKISILYYIGLCLLVMACSKTEDDNNTPANTQIALDIAPYIETNTDWKNNSGQKSDGFSSQDQIGVFAVKSGVTPSQAEQVYNKKYVYNGSSWKADGQIYWPEGEMNEACKLYAYYPYSPSMSDIKQHFFAVSTDQSTPAKLRENDFMYGKKNIAKQNAKAEFAMSHLFSLLTVNLKYKGEEEINCKSLTVNAQQIANINLDDGTTTLYGTKTTALTAALLETPASGFNLSYSVILPPQTIQTTSAIKVNYQDGSCGYEKLDKTFESGKHYTLEGTISREGLTIENIYVAEWQEEVIVTGGKIAHSAKVYKTGDVITYQKKRETKPVTLVVIGDGFTKEELKEKGLFEQSAQQGIEFLFEAEPFHSYRDYFNVYFIAAESNETGSDNTTTNVKRDTYFDSQYNSTDYNDLKADHNKVMNFVRTYCPDIKNGKTDITKTAVFMLINDTRYGGICQTWSDGMSYMLCPLIPGSLTWTGKEPNIDGSSTGTWKNIFLHEGGGHCFGKLTDEYWSDNNSQFTGSVRSEHSWPVPFGKNVSASKTSSVWHDMIGDPQFPKVNYFEGGWYYGKGLWRSERISCMIDNRSYFNAASRRLIVERIKTLAGESFSYNDFLQKDVNYDKILDSSSNGVMGGNVDPADLKFYPLLPPPVLMEK